MKVKSQNGRSWTSKEVKKMSMMIIPWLHFSCACDITVFIVVPSNKVAIPALLVTFVEAKYKKSDTKKTKRSV